MVTTDARVDAYIAKSPDYAKPILNHIRALVHSACPQARETIKWQRPHFEYKGIVCGMSAFKEYCRIMYHDNGMISSELESSEDKQIKNLSDLPPDKVLTEYIKKKTALNEAGIKKPKAPKPAVAKPVVVPDYFTKALKKNKTAFTMFEKMAPGRRREYIEWLTEAKQEETRAKRMKTAVEWIAEGKSRHWKYQGGC